MFTGRSRAGANTEGRRASRRRPTDQRSGWAAEVRKCAKCGCLVPCGRKRRCIFRCAEDLDWGFTQPKRNPQGFCAGVWETWETRVNLRRAGRNFQDSQLCRESFRKPEKQKLQEVEALGQISKFSSENYWCYSDLYRFYSFQVPSSGGGRRGEKSAGGDGNDAPMDGGPPDSRSKWTGISRMRTIFSTRTELRRWLQSRGRKDRGFR